MQATLTTYLYADGDTYPFTQTVIIPALAVGASYTTKTLSSQATQGDSIQGTVQIGSGSVLNFTL